MTEGKFKQYQSFAMERREKSNTDKGGRKKEELQENEGKKNKLHEDNVNHV